MKDAMERVFWSADIGFVVDLQHMRATRLTDSATLKELKVADELEQTGRLPHRGGAPVASWIIARLLELTHGGIGIDERENLFNDGGVIQLDWIAFSRALKPVAMFQQLCYSNRVELHGQVLRSVGAAALKAALLDALLLEPKTVRVCRITVTDTDPPTAPGKLGRRYVFGWDGKQFLGTRDYE